MLYKQKLANWQAVAVPRMRSLCALTLLCVHAARWTRCPSSKSRLKLCFSSSARPTSWICSGAAFGTASHADQGSRCAVGHHRRSASLQRRRDGAGTAARMGRQCTVQRLKTIGADGTMCACPSYASTAGGLLPARLRRFARIAEPTAPASCGPAPAACLATVMPPTAMRPVRSSTPSSVGRVASRLPPRGRPAAARLGDEGAPARRRCDARARCRSLRRLANAHSPRSMFCTQPLQHGG